MTTPRIGLIGHGYIGKYVYEQFSTRPELGLQIGFVHDGRPDVLAELPSEIVLADLGDFASRGVDLVVELAHPDVTRQHGERFLSTTDYMPLSLTAFADAELNDRLQSTARERGTRIFVPHGAVVGMEALEEGRDTWDEVSIRMEKPVKSLDLSADPHHNVEDITQRTTLFEGSAREICPLYPRNVNSHAAVALAGIGFERTQSSLIADPALETSIIEITARGDGVDVTIRRENPMAGVSGLLTLMSVLSSVCRAKATQPGLRVV